MLKTFICPYCSTNLGERSFSEECWNCWKKYGIYVFIYYDGTIEMANGTFHIKMNKNKAVLFAWYDGTCKLIIDNCPLDKSLTPENFEKKVKTYLTFQ